MQAQKKLVIKDKCQPEAEQTWVSIIRFKRGSRELEKKSFEMEPA